MASDGGSLQLTAALATYPHTAALVRGEVTWPGMQVDVPQFGSLLLAIRAMCRERCFDMSEMPLGTYLVGRELGTAFTALPVFVQRQRPQRQIVTRRLGEPRDLTGGRVGVRTYTATSGIWVRGLLAEVYGLDAAAITWVTVDEEHFEAYEPPANVAACPGADLREMLLAGEIDAAIGVPPDSCVEIRPLLVDGVDGEQSVPAPINHTVVVRSELLQEHPWLAPALRALFDRAKEQAALSEDLYPYGIEPNRETLIRFVRLAREQDVLRDGVDLEVVFA